MVRFVCNFLHFLANQFVIKIIYIESCILDSLCYHYYLIFF